MSLLTKIEQLSNKEKVFIFCNNENTPELFNTKVISISDESRFIVFVSRKNKIKIGVKIVRNNINYSKFNKKSKCQVITDLVSEKNEVEFESLSLQKKLKKQKQLEKTLTLQKSALPEIKVTAGNYAVNKVKTTIQQNLKTYIKKLIEIDKTYRGFVELLNKENPYNSSRDAHIFIDMIPDKKKLLEIQQIINLEYQPILKNLLDNNFNLTNIAPIIIDKKKIFVRDENDDITLKKTNEQFNNTFLIKNLLKLHDSGNDPYDIGDIPLELNLTRNFIKQGEQPIHVKSYIDFIRKLNGHEGVNLETELNAEFTESSEGTVISYDPPHLSYLTPQKGYINNMFYPVTVKHTTNLFRRSYKSDNNLNTGCATLAFNEEGQFTLTRENSNKITYRKSNEAIYYLKDVYDDVKIGNTKTCNGTNKSGDIFYLGKDFKSSELNKSQSTPPKKISIYDGEEVLVCGFFIHSPNDYNRLIGSKEIYNEETNSKEYSSLYTNYKTLVDINKKNSKKPIKIIENITNFSLVNYSNYNPDYDYFVLIGSVDPGETKNKLSRKEWVQNIKHVAPTLKQIFNILNSETDDIRGIPDIEMLLNKYYFSFSQFPQTPFINVLKNKIYENNKTTKELSRDHHKNSLNLKNQSDITNKLFRELIRNEEDVFPFLDFLNDYTLKKTVHKKLLKKLYGFISGKKLKTMTNIEEQISQLVRRNFKKNLLNNLDEDIFEQIKQYSNKIHKSKLVYQNSVFSPRVTEYISDNSKNDYLSKNILKAVIELANLYKIKNIIREEEEKYDFNMDKKIKEMQQEIDNIIHTYEEERERQIDFLKRCRGVRITKEYTSIRQVNKDNISNVYRDLKYDTLYSDLNSLFTIIGDAYTVNSLGIRQFKLINEDTREAFEALLLKKYLYLDKKNIGEKLIEVIEFYDKFRFNLEDPNMDDILHLLENYDDQNKKMFYNLKIAAYHLRNSIKPDDIALLETRNNKYLFKRSGTIWHIVTEEEFTETTKAFIHDDKNILKLKTDELEELFKKIRPPSKETQPYCINVEQYSIPIELYNLIADISNKKIFIKNCQTIIKYKNSIADNIDNKIKDVEKKFTLQKLKLKKEQLPNIVISKEKKMSLIPKSVITKYLDIFKIRDFDTRMQTLLEFVELYGINYCLADSCEELEKSSETSNSYYYNSGKFVMKLCCKHDMCYKDFRYKTNVARNEILEKMKVDYGVVEGDTYICKLCGTTIGDIKYSSFEGFGAANALIMFREEDRGEENIELYEEDLSIRNEKEFYSKYTKNPELLALKYIISELGITLTDIDLNFILSEVDALSVGKLYDNFIKTNIIKKSMIKIFKFTQTLNSKKEGAAAAEGAGDKKKKKKKKKQSGVLVGGTIINTKIQGNVFEKLKKGNFAKKIKQDNPTDYSNLENVFTQALKDEITKFNNAHPDSTIPLDEDLLLKNIGDINKLLQFLNKVEDANIIIVVLLANIQQLFNMYIRGYKFIMALKYLIVVLQYSLPEYKINPYLMISKNPSLRGSGKNYLIQNLYYSRDYIIRSIFDIIETTLANKKTSKGFYIKKIISLFDNILGAGLKFSPVPKGKVSKETKKQMFLNNLIIFENVDIDSIGSKKKKLKEIYNFFTEKIKTETNDIVAQVDFINSLKTKRISYEHEREFKEDFTLKWNEFLPAIETGKLIKVDLTGTYQINETTVVSIYNLNKHLSKLCNNYILLVNKLFNVINTYDDMTYYNYTSSEIFSNINFTFTDYFNLENFESHKIEYPAYLIEESPQKEEFKECITDLRKILNHMNLLNTKLSYQRTEIDSPIYIMTNNNNYVRNLQEYTDFDILYEDKSLIYYINRLKLLFTTYYINVAKHLDPNDTTIIDKTRVFKTIKDPNNDIILKVLQEQLKNPIGDDTKDGDESEEEGYEGPAFNLISQYTELIGEKRNIIIEEILKRSPDDELGDTSVFFMGDNEGTYNIDMETGEFKEKIEYNIENDYIQKDIPTIKAIIKTIESKIYKLYDTGDRSTSFTADITFENNYILTINKINTFLQHIFTTRGDSIYDITDLSDIINLEDVDIQSITEYWDELNSISFVSNIGTTHEGILSNLQDKSKLLFTDIFIENNHQLDKFYSEKLEEIENDLRIILFEDEIEKEQIFYQEKFKSDNEQNTLKIFIYLLKFLICKSLMVYKNYKNNILIDLEKDRNITKTSLDTEDNTNISDIYSTRYGAILELSTISNLDEYKNDYDDICKNICLIIGLLNENSLTTAQNVAFIKDLTVKLLYLINILFSSNNDYTKIINMLFMDEVDTIFETFKTRQYDIQNYMNIKKTKGNQNRKRQFDKKTDEDKLSHKLYRRFNLGKILDLNDNVYKETTVVSETVTEEDGYSMGDANADTF
uniref:Uncharacterized protein n=1 Tax=viral metagenome TaxID=1070528 RepID=A0A6C0B5H7_9ZZZZ